MSCKIVSVKMAKPKAKKTKHAVDPKKILDSLRYDQLNLTPTFVEFLKADDPKMFEKLASPKPGEKVTKGHLEALLKGMKIGIDDLFEHGIVRSQNEEVSRMKRIVKKKNQRVRAESRLEKAQAAKMASKAAQKAAIGAGMSLQKAKKIASRAAEKARTECGKVQELSRVTKNLKVIKYTVQRGCRKERDADAPKMGLGDRKAPGDKDKKEPKPPKDPKDPKDPAENTGEKRPRGRPKGKAQPKDKDAKGKAKAKAKGKKSAKDLKEEKGLKIKKQTKKQLMEEKKALMEAEAKRDKKWDFLREQY